jgi:acyl-CoA reductase-like NAD-dependent aldehyde dehydrogenase
VAAVTYLADEKTFNSAVDAGVKATAECREMSSLERYKSLMYIAAELEKKKKESATILATESAKPMKYALAEIERSITTFTIAAEESKRLPKEYISLDWTANGKKREGLINYFPVGLVGGIAPFNFPMNLAVHKIAPAIACGCPIILKPASSTPLSTLNLAKIIDKSGLPKGAVSILPMDRKTGNLLVTDERIKLLSFTGSPLVGWELKKQSGKKKVVLELGGNAGVIVTDSANTDDMIGSCITGAFSYSGQICIHAQRFYVHPDHFEKFCRQMTESAKKLSFGDPLHEHTTMSVMIDEENAVRVEEWVNEALSKGAKLLCGGKREGSYYEPTVLTGTTKEMKVTSEEIFGPVICIEKYNGDILDAIAKVNDTKFGLQCGVYTNSISELDLAFRYLEVGGVIHNEMPTLRFDQMPYGGIKDSGLGREGVKYAIRDMSEAKVLVK